MSVISFSGLVTGLDTNSWVSALTALKNAKVEELQAERNTITVLKDVVSGIKTYFSTFRSSLERLTDAKFGVDSLDIFVQNLANSSNPSKVTATATSSASRDTYEVGVTQLASATKVNTAIRNTITVTYTADETTKLSRLGVKEGYVSVNNKEFQIENHDTIGSLLEKLESIGVTAYYEEDIGRFTIASDIYEVDAGSTELFTSLGIEFQTVTGVQTDVLMVEGYVTIKPTTLLADIGAVGGDIMINKTLENMAFDATSTVQDVIDWFNNKYGAGTAEMDAEGVITLHGLDIDELSGGANIVTALGLEEKVDSVTSTSEELSYVHTESALWSTELGKLNSTFANYELVLGDGTTNSTVTLSATSTLNDVKVQIEAYATANGMTADIQLAADGTISIAGNIDDLYMSGGIIDGLGLEQATVNGTEFTSSNLSYVLTTTAATGTTFKDLEISAANLTYDVLNERGEVIQANTFVTEDTTIEQWFDSMKQYGITGSISEDGVITIDGGLVSGNLATALGLSSVVSGNVISETKVESKALAGTITTTATMTSTLESLGINTAQTLTIQGSTSTKTVTFETTATLQDVADAISTCGGSMTIDENGNANIEGVNKLSGSLVTALNMEEQTIQGTSMYNTNLAYTVKTTASGDTKLSEMGCSGASLSFTVFDATGTSKATVTMSDTDTVDTLISTLNTYGVTANISETGVLSMENGYITGGLADQLGITRQVASTYVSSNTITSNTLSGVVTTTITTTSTLADLGISTAQTLDVRKNGVTTSLTFATTSTIQDVLDAIEDAGGVATFENHKLEISDVDTISGTLATSLGLTGSGTGNSTTIYSSGVNYTIGSIATESSKFSEYGITTSGKSYNIYASNGDLLASGLTLAADATISDMISSLTSLGLSAYVDSAGAINISGGYITGTMATELGITSSAYKTVVTEVTQLSSGLKITVPTVATMATVLGSIGVSGTKYLTVNHDGTSTTYTFTSTDTLADVAAAVASSGGHFDVTDGYLAVSEVSLSGDLLTALGITHKGGAVETYTETHTEITSNTVNGIISQTLTTITTTLTTTESLYYSSGQKTYNVESTNIDPGSTKLSQLGVSEGTVNIYNGSTNSTATVYTITADSTISDLLAALRAQGIDAEYNSARISFAADKHLVVQNGTSNLVTALGMNQGIEYETLTRNTTSNEYSNLSTQALAATTTLGVFATTAAERVVTLETNGDVISKTFAATNTVQDVMDFLSANGITATMTNGVFEASSSYQEFSISGSLGNVIIGANPTITTGTRTDEWSATINDRTAAATIDGNTKLISMGVTTGDIKVYDNGEYIPTAINISENTTINDLISSLSNFGMTATLSGGKLNITANSEIYLLDETSNLVSKLGLTTNNFGYTTIYAASTQTGLVETTTGTIDTTTKVGDLGFTDGADLRINMDGEVYSINFSENETMQDVIDALATYGITANISGGTFTASSTDKTFTLTGDIGKALATDTPVTSTITTVTGYTAELPLSVNDVEINENTKIVNLGVREGALKIYDNGTWINTAINIKADTTIGDFITSLENYGFTASLDGGKISISADSDKYIADETTNLVTKLELGNKTQTKVNVYDQTNSNTLVMTRTYTTSETTTLKDLGFDSGASLRIEIGGVMQTIGFTADETVEDVMNSMESFGIQTQLVDGVLTGTTTSQTFKLMGTLADVLSGAAPSYVTTEAVTGYETDELTEDITTIASTDTKLSDLGVATGYINLLKDGNILTTVAIRDDTTVGQFFSAIQAYGVAGNVDANGVITIESVGDVTFMDATSDLVSVLGLDDNVYSNTYNGTTMVLEENVNIATGETLVSYYDTADKKAEGAVYFSLTDQDGNVINEVINIEADDTMDDLVAKLEAIGLHAEFADGKLSYHYGLGEVAITGGDSVFTETLGLIDTDLEQWMQSVDTIDYEQEEIEYLSVCNYADNATTLETLGVSTGEFSLGLNGSMARVTVSSTDTLSSVMAKISTATGGSVTATLTADGKFHMEAAEGVELIVGTATDTTNLVTIFNLDQNGTNVINGQTSLYKASSSSKLTTSGIFRLGDVTEGTFSIGNATFTVTSDTTIASLINEINHSEDANANAYWDNINGKMILTSASLGSSYVSVQGGSSNFTEIFGLTVNEGGQEKLTTYNQTLGNNAILTINGTRIVSTSNTITSDISRIEGLTVNIKDITEGEYVTITVERDTQAVVDAVQETLDSYNQLIAALNNTLGIGGALHGDTALRSIKNQLQLMMTAKATNGSNQFRNLSGIGISTDSASSAMPTDIYSLYLDQDKLARSMDISEDDVKALLVGTETDPGVLTKVENLIETMLSGNGYFNSKNKALDREIERYDVKIERAQRRTQSYKEILERQFHSMEMIYSKMQTSYQNVGASKIF